MRARKLTFVALLASGLALAQNAGELEVRGRLVEAGLSAGIAGARIVLYQFSIDSKRSVFATGVTDSQGNFAFHPDRPGNYYVDATKPGYLSTSRAEPATQESFAAILAGTTVDPPDNTGALATLNRDHPQEFVRLALMRPTAVTGHVVDDNEKPAAGLLVEVLDSALGVRATSRTTQEGAFAIKGLRPDRYFLRVSALDPRLFPPMTVFTDADLNANDQAMETLYWPGVRDFSAAGIVGVVSGTTIDLGSFHLHTGLRHRAKVSVSGCKSGDSLRFSAIPSARNTALRADGTLTNSIGTFPIVIPGCSDFLIRGLEPGSYDFALSTQNAWALQRVEIVDSNLVVELNLAPEGEIIGSIALAHDGIQLPLSRPMLVQLSPLGAPPFVISPLSMTKVVAGKFSVKGIRWPRNFINVSGFGARFYVKEVRVDGVAAPGGTITVGPLS